MFFLFTALSQSKLSHLNSNLEAIKTSRFWDLDFLAKTLDQVFIHNAIASSEEGKNMLDEIPFIILGNTRKKKYNDHVTGPDNPRSFSKHLQREDYTCQFKVDFFKA